jgi:hypothetical protein
LKYHGDAPRSRGQLRDHLPPDQYISGSGFLQTGYHSQKGSFAAPRRTQQHEEFFLVADYVDSIYSFYITKMFFQTSRFNFRQWFLLLFSRTFNLNKIDRYRDQKGKHLDLQAFGGRQYRFCRDSFLPLCSLKGHNYRPLS